jgi:hypothetical protein
MADGTSLSSDRGEDVGIEKLDGFPVVGSVPGISIHHHHVVLQHDGVKGSPS